MSFSKIIDGLRQEVDVIRTVGYDFVPGENKDDVKSVNNIPQFIESMSGDSLLGSIKYDSNFYVVWTSLYKRDFLLTNKMLYVEHMSYEDSDWTLRCLHAAKSVAIVAYNFVFHRMRDDSLANIPSTRSFLDNIRSATLVDQAIDRLELRGDTLTTCRRRNKRAVLSYVKKTRNYTIQQSRECIAALNATPLLDTTKYQLSIGERFLFWCLRYSPMALIISVKVLTLSKRVILSFLKR